MNREAFSFREGPGIWVGAVATPNLFRSVYPCPFRFTLLIKNTQLCLEGNTVVVGKRGHVSIRFLYSEAPALISVLSSPLFRGTASRGLESSLVKLTYSPPYK